MSTDQTGALRLQIYDLIRIKLRDIFGHLSLQQLFLHYPVEAPKYIVNIRNRRRFRRLQAG